MISIQTLNVGIGIRAARVKVLFELPPEYGPAAHALAYLEWYTPFTAIDSLLNMYQVSRSTRNHKPNVSVVSVERILGHCHLIGKCGQNIDRSWTCDNVLDKASVFYVNPYFTIGSFASSGLYNNF